MITHFLSDKYQNAEGVSGESASGQSEALQGQTQRRLDSRSSWPGPYLRKQQTRQEPVLRGECGPSLVYRGGGEERGREVPEGELGENSLASDEGIPWLYLQVNSFKLRSGGIKRKGGERWLGKLEFQSRMVNMENRKMASVLKIATEIYDGFGRCIKMRPSATIVHRICK